MPASESPAHLHLKRLALLWAQAHRFPIAACEVALPNLRFRLDAGAYRPGSIRLVRPGHRTRTVAAIGTAAIFECKASRADFLRDARQTPRLLARLQILGTRRATLERLLPIHCPSLRGGDALWPEFESFAFDRLEHAPYQKIVAEMRLLTSQLHAQTKLDHLIRWQAAHLHYLVTEPGTAHEHEIPPGWGWLLREGDRLRLARLPVWHPIEDPVALSFLHRVAMAGTKAVNREANITFTDLAEERARGISSPGTAEIELRKPE